MDCRVEVGGEVSDSKKTANSYWLAERRFWSWDCISAAAERKTNSCRSDGNKVVVMGLYFRAIPIFQKISGENLDLRSDQTSSE